MESELYRGIGKCELGTYGFADSNFNVGFATDGNEHDLQRICSKSKSCFEYWKCMFQNLDAQVARECALWLSRHRECRVDVQKRRD